MNESASLEKELEDARTKVGSELKSSFLATEMVLHAIM